MSCYAPVCLLRFGRFISCSLGQVLWHVADVDCLVREAEARPGGTVRPLLQVFQVFKAGARALKSLVGLDLSTFCGEFCRECVLYCTCIICLCIDHRLLVCWHDSTAIAVAIVCCVYRYTENCKQLTGLLRRLRRRVGRGCRLRRAGGSRAPGAAQVPCAHLTPRGAFV